MYVVKKPEESGYGTLGTDFSHDFMQRRQALQSQEEIGPERLSSGERMRRRRALRTPEQIERQRTLARERTRKRRALQKLKKMEAGNACDLDNLRKTPPFKTPEQIERKRMYARERMRRRRALRTPEEIEREKNAAREAMRKKRTLQKPEEIECERLLGRVRMRRKRALQKQKERKDIRERAEKTERAPHINSAPVVLYAVSQFSLRLKMLSNELCRRRHNGKIRARAPVLFWSKWSGVKTTSFHRIRSKYADFLPVVDKTKMLVGRKLYLGCHEKRTLVISCIADLVSSGMSNMELCNLQEFISETESFLTEARNTRQMVKHQLCKLQNRLLKSVTTTLYHMKNPNDEQKNAALGGAHVHSRSYDRKTRSGKARQCPLLGVSPAPVRLLFAEEDMKNVKQEVEDSPPMSVDCKTEDDEAIGSDEPCPQFNFAWHKIIKSSVDKIASAGDNYKLSSALKEHEECHTCKSNGSCPIDKLQYCTSAHHVLTETATCYQRLRSVLRNVQEIREYYNWIRIYDDACKHFTMSLLRIHILPLSLPRLVRPMVAEPVVL